MNKDFKYLNVPASLEREAWLMLSDEEGGPILDIAWMRREARRLQVLVLFFRDNNLLIEPARFRDDEWEQVVLHLSSFTEEGQRFIMADYPGKWDAAWDRNPNKDPADVRYLEMRLRQLRKAMANP